MGMGFLGEGVGATTGAGGITGSIIVFFLGEFFTSCLLSSSN